ncbi:uncharacterized protein LOC123441387 [Hordeum vulgare subsp. vulgare]|uniref:DUF4220 domain-containing protein n=1 Tax=Hordeum vulgare subsp. vulgare TaxID=112509 RepID=A0A8I6XU62_HORVV|nr:uncharacterized protein LOC123441387 [Hordeum vulgare subsp. vulgare]
MGVSGAVVWWEEWQLRVLVLCSLLIQYFLLAATVARKFPIRSYFRPFIWLAYLGSDAVAIYALAVLFNRHRKPQQPEEDGEGGGSRLLEVLWAPILLMHLGGQDGITAYNIEDNELWTRHILTSVSQVVVAVYVFWKSWSGSDMRLLQAATLLFILGILRCFEKPFALNRASINSLVSSGEPVWRSINTHKLKIDPLEDFIDKATNPAEENIYLLAPSMPADFTPHKLFVDLASPSANDRIRVLLSFSALDDNHAYCTLQNWISHTFRHLYTKQNWFLTASGRAGTNKRDREGNSVGFYVVGTRVLAVFLPFTAVALFQHSHREIYSEQDVKVTYVLLCCTAVLEICAFGTRFEITFIEVSSEPWDDTSDIETPEPSENISHIETPEPTELKPKYDDMVSQHSLIGLLVRNRKHSKMMSIVGFLRCNNVLHQHWHMNSCSSSFSITKLVLQYVKSGWKHHIKDVPSYRKFNDNRGQFTIQQQGCYQELGWSLEGAFDESVLLWHLATDFCYYDSLPSHHGSWCTKDFCHVYGCPAWCEGSDHHKRAVQCREMSNYMMYLLFVNPEMLMAGTRRNLFTVAYDELKSIDIQQSVEERELTSVMRRELIRNKERSITRKEDEQPENGIREKVGGTISQLEGDKQTQKERELSQRIIIALDGRGSPPTDGTQQKTGIINDAWTIAKVLSGLPEEKMWTMIEGVWVEMMCFSAARCRGYLHAKGLATGVEYLTYVWLLQYYMGMETLADKLQRADHHHHAPSTSGVSKEATQQEQAASPSRSSGSASQSAGHQGSDATATAQEIGEEMV